MSCNCNPITQCGNCARGVPCNCPPVYPIPHSTVPCNCCPPGYTLFGATPNFPNGFCQDNATGKIQIAPMPCVVCEEIIPTDCVIYNGQIPIACGTPPNNIYGIVAGDSLTTIVSKMCITNENVMEALLTAIGLSPRALAGFCHLVGNCGLFPGTTTPILGPITFTIP